MVELFFTVWTMSWYGAIAALAVSLIFLLFRRTRVSKTALLFLWLGEGAADRPLPQGLSACPAKKVSDRIDKMSATP